jgi:predicted Zn-dependent peptidase
MTLQLTTLENGIRVVSDTVPTVETVSVGMWVQAGTRHETKAINGISHLLEHMAFKGTEKRTARQIAEEIEAVGGYLNAYTSRESTAYYARVLKDNTPLAVDIISDILQNSIFDQEELTREKSVVIQEIGQTNDTPDDIIFDYFHELAFPDQPMGWPILGTIPIVQSLTSENLKAYMAQEYTPERLVLAAAGNISHEELVQLARHHWGALPSSGKEKSWARPLATYKGGQRQEVKDLEQVHVVLGFEGTSFHDKGLYPLMVLSTILGGGMSSRLFQEIREKRGLAYSIYTHNSAYQETGIFEIYSGTSPKDAGELVPVILEELHKVTTTLEEEEIQRAKAQMKAGLMMGLESMSSRCEQIANHVLNFGNPIPRSEILQRIDRVTAQDLHHQIQLLLKGAPCLVTLGTHTQAFSL